MKVILQGQKVSGLPEGGADGQILTKTETGIAWKDAPEGGVTSFKGRTGAVTPQEGDYTAGMVGARPDTWTPSAADVGAVPTSRTVNGQELSQDINLTADNVGARPSTWTPTASDVGAIPNPSGGTTGQILEKTASGTQWADKPSGGIPIVTTSGTGAEYIATVPGVTELYNGLSIIILPHVTNELAPYINVNGLGKKFILQYSTFGNNGGQLMSEFFRVNSPYLLMYSTGLSNWVLCGIQTVSNTQVRIVNPTMPNINRARGIELRTSVPSSIPNGSIVGVYEA